MAKAALGVRARVGAAILILVGVCALRAWAPPAPAGTDRGHRSRDADFEAEGFEDEDADRATGADEANRQRFLQRADETGEIPMHRLLEAKTQIDAMRMRHQDAGLWDWYWLGPGNIGGRIRTVLPHPTISGRIWVGSVSGGIWRTDNAGGSWFAVDDFMANLAVTSMVMDPTNSNILYAGTGEGFFNLDALPGAGIFKSTNGGVNWFQLASTNNANFKYVNRLAHHPTTTGTLFAVTGNLLNGPWQVQRSTDGGNTWTSLLTTASPPTDIKIDPANAMRILVGTWGNLASSPATFGDVYLSTNGGTGWRLETNDGANELPSDGGRSECAFGPGGVRYVSMERNGGEVWRSTAVDTAWTRQSTGTNYLGTQGWYNNAIWVDPTNSSFVVVGGIDLWKSTNSGTTLTQISKWQSYHLGTSAHADQHAIVAHPGYNGSTNRQVYFGNDGGIQTAVNVGTVSQTSGWTNLANNLGITQFYGGAASPNGSLIVGGAQDNNRLHYTGNPSAWTQDSTGDGGYCAVDFTNPSIVYGELPRLFIMRSTNGGASYNPRVSGLSDAGSTTNSLFIAPFVMDPNNANILWAGSYRIWRTTNGGGAWSLMQGGITGGFFVTALGVKPGNSNEIWAGYTNGTVTRSTDGGTTWTPVDGGSPGLPDRWVTDIAVSPYFSNEAIVTFAGYNSDNVWATFDGGANWSRRTGGGADTLPALQVNCVSYHPVSPDWIYIGTDLAVFASEDFGATWGVTPNYGFSEGPANVEVDDLFWYSDWMVVATHGRGMYASRPLTIVYVDQANGGPEDGSAAHPYNTVTEGINAAGHGTALSIRSATYNDGAVSFYKRGTVSATGGSVVIQ